MLYLFVMKRILPFALLALLLISSCTVTENLDIYNKDSGSSTANIKVEQFFIDVLEDFGEFLPSSDQSIMDEAMEGFSAQLNNSTSTETVAFKKTGTNAYELRFDYTNISSLLADLGAPNQSLLQMTDNSMKFYVDIDNFEELTKIVPFLADPNFEVYGPMFNQGTSEEDYLDMIYYLLGEDGPDAIKNGSISVYINVPGKITNLEHATKIDKNTALATFPIIDFLLLNEPLTFTINWN